jgi:predicted NBD/HSP70 family sugar kinase
VVPLRLSEYVHVRLQPRVSSSSSVPARASMNSLVFDIGGSWIRAGLWNSNDGSLIARAQTPSPGLNQKAAGDPLEQLLQALRGLGEQLVGSEQVPISIGVAFPGPVDALGRAGQAPTLWGETGRAEPFDFGAAVNARLWDRPTRIVNDLTAAGMRYASPGKDFWLVTVSSGIGNKVFLDGKPVLGSNHKGGEIGHWRVDSDPSAPLCECSGRGHLGALASGRATPFHFRETKAAEPRIFASSALKELGYDSPDLNREVAKAFKSGDSFATEVVRRLAAPMGTALANLHLAIGIERFVIIGGWAAVLGAFYLDLLAESAASNSWGDAREWPARIEAGLDDDDSGLIGMGRLLSMEPH